MTDKVLQPRFSYSEEGGFGCMSLNPINPNPPQKKLQNPRSKLTVVYAGSLLYRF